MSVITRGFDKAGSAEHSHAGGAEGPQHVLGILLDLFEHSPGQSLH